MDGYIKQRNASRYNWLKILTSQISNVGAGKSRGHLNIGIIGALGAYDVGDEAMLIALASDLRRWCSEVNITVFSMRPPATEEYLQLRSLPSLHSWAFDRKSMVSLAMYAIDQVETLFTRVAKKKFDIDETCCNGWCLRAFYSLVSKYVESLARRHRNGNLLNSNSRLYRHIIDIDSLDLLIVLGGGYLNSWHVKARSHLFAATIDIAAILGKPVFGTGLNLGPFNCYDRRKLASTLKRLKVIGFRDRNESFVELRRMGIFDARIHFFSSDDAITLDASPLGDEGLRSLVRNIGPYVAVQAHAWRLEATSLNKFLSNLADALDLIVEHLGLRILLIPMTFGKKSSHDDVAILEQVKSLCRHKAALHTSFDKLAPQQLKYLFSHASAAVVTRHHAMVFALSEGVPCVAVVLDEYYRMKLRGVSEEYEELCYLVPRAEASSEVLFEQVRFYINAASHRKEL